MNIKNAFRYQNYLSELQSEAQNALFRVRVTQTELHQKSLANPDAPDEVIVAENTDIAAGITAPKCIALILDIFEEKAALDKAISNTKRACDFDLDAELNINKNRRALVSHLSCFTTGNDMEQMSRAQDYKFNAEGNQTPYSYPVKISTKLNYDKNQLASMVKQLSAAADEMSDNVDVFLLETTFPFTPKFNIHEKFEDIVKTYAD